MPGAVETIEWVSDGGFADFCLCCECQNRALFTIVGQFKSADTVVCEDGYIVVAENGVPTGNTCPADKQSGDPFDGAVTEAEAQSWEDGGDGSSVHTGTAGLSGSFVKARYKLQLITSVTTGPPDTITIYAGYRTYNIDSGLTTTYGTPTTVLLERVSDVDDDRLWQSADWIATTDANPNETNGVEVYAPTGICLDQWSPDIVLAD